MRDGCDGADAEPEAEGWEGERREGKDASGIGGDLLRGHGVCRWRDEYGQERGCGFSVLIGRVAAQPSLRD